MDDEDALAADEAQHAPGRHELPMTHRWGPRRWVVVGALVVAALVPSVGASHELQDRPRRPLVTVTTVVPDRSTSAPVVVAPESVSPVGPRDLLVTVFVLPCEALHSLVGTERPDSVTVTVRVGTRRRASCDGEPRPVAAVVHLSAPLAGRTITTGT